MREGLLWLPLLVIFVVLTALGWLERRRQTLFRSWAQGAELAKLDATVAMRLQDGRISWGPVGPRGIELAGDIAVNHLELCELMADRSGDVPLTDEASGPCRLRLVANGQSLDIPFSDAVRARLWVDELMSQVRCQL
ncbi:MAG: hypothetical protein F4X84_00955 [Synechococcus sp. SB0662_bin_45]|uniref:Uncharacterized protein n=1 Tax=Synechococcus sp. SB0676_bin_10 TaxID=2604869 RepID=A0A6B1F8E0_9SYNE|nr:hypothetical protein [Cyanobacteria bacterium MAG IRC3_bin_20]MCY3654770.1 hypothetical protein [Cyanobacteria bacterium MAG IRC1_bin_28]MDE0647513.1 hypothetical protein [Cyanobacteria bacterium MAG IRC4_bin_6]MXW13152.1 hypothetical protein [Synechococcus sp. SB0668_bin_13]MXX08054.1 hypothetical protein [Synechococcus sp. SB0667_bin_8]MXY19495.1 hypothetical protein [Synechococcus sp. SB0664_bin_36]MXY62864.1 hypothetical protein [Synechococcus sp. SB0665_bin_28]MYE20972.1 hypothetical